MGIQLKGSDRWLLPLSGILLVMGGLLGMQVHTQRQRGVTEIGRRTSALAEVLSANQSQAEEQRKEIASLRQRLTDYEKEASSGQGMTKVITEELQASRIALGLVPLKGPGVVLEVNDSTLLGKDSGDNDLLLIHEGDLVAITNELWADGAEAIAVNGQRLVAGSAFVCSGRLIRVNNEAISAPFTFTAIGDQRNLVSGLNMPNGLIDKMRVMEFQVNLTQKNDLEVPPIAVTPKYRFATPVKQEVAAK
jgi:uncharacterized protein YlxW (UPF0749 family)